MGRAHIGEVGRSAIEVEPIGAFESRGRGGEDVDVAVPVDVLRDRPQRVVRRERIGELDEVAYFDVYPSSDAAQFNGSWSNYPYLPSGVIPVSLTSKKGSSF